MNIDEQVLLLYSRGHQLVDYDPLLDRRHIFKFLTDPNGCMIIKYII